MEMEMEDRLPGRSPGGVDEVDAVGVKRSPDHVRHLDRRGHHLRRVGRLDVPQVRRMALGDHQDVAGGGGVDVHDHDHRVVFVDALGRGRSRHDRAEDASILHTPEGTGQPPGVVILEVGASALG